MKSLEIKKIYKDLAKKYDKRIKEGKYRAYHIMALWALKNITGGKKRILDLGCGTGLSSVQFFRKGHKVVGIDISKDMLSEAKKYPFEKLICQDLEQPLKVRDRYFDVVMLVGTMEFIKNPYKLFKQIYSKLKNQGIFLVTIPKKLSKSTRLKIRNYTRDKIEPIFLKAGFEIIGSKSFFGYYKKIEKSNEAVEYFAYLLKKKK